MLTQALRLSPAIRPATGDLHKPALVLRRYGRHQTFAAFRPATVQHFTTLSGRHTRTESMRVGPLHFARLIRSLHIPAPNLSLRAAPAAPVNKSPALNRAKSAGFLPRFQPYVKFFPDCPLMFHNRS